MQFPIGRPVPFGLVKKIVAFRVKENSAKARPPEDEYFEKVCSARVRQSNWKTKCVSHKVAWAKTAK